jgi:hypothetical protein
VFVFVDTDEATTVVLPLINLIALIEVLWFLKQKKRSKVVLTDSVSVNNNITTIENDVISKGNNKVL